MDELAALETRLSARMRRERFYGFAIGAALLLTLATGRTQVEAPPMEHAVANNSYPVTVVNPITAPVPVHPTDISAHEPFVVRVYPGTSGPGTFTVPLHKRLVVTSIDCYNYTGTVNAYEIDGTTAGVGNSTYVPMTSSGVMYTAIHAVFDAGTTVYIFPHDTNLGDNGGQNVDIRGYYVDQDGYYRNDNY